MGQFALQVDKWVSKEAKGKTQNLIRAIALEFFSSVILDTPVDTGRARGNWQISRHNPVEDTLTITDPSGGATILKVEEVLFGTDITDSDVQFFLTNNLPYIARLEFDGYSKQAPEGMVRKNAIRIQNQLKTRYG